MTTPIVLNDVHSRLNPTWVRELVSPRSVEQIAAAVHHATKTGLPVSTCGGRHAMGGQQFVEGGLQFDLTSFDQIIDFRPDQRLITVQAGIQWPSLLAALQKLQANSARPLTFRQKQTGADRLSIGGGAQLQHPRTRPTLQAPCRGHRVVHAGRRAGATTPVQPH